MQRIVTSVWLIIVSCVGVGCHATPDDGVEPASAALSAAGRSAPTIAQFCGPIARNKTCPSGEVCTFTNSKRLGRCIADPTGQLCGPDAIPHACPAGFECDFSGGIDVGHCMKKSSACVSAQAGPCGGNTTRPCTCAEGLVCTPGDSGVPFGDVGGTCQQPTSECSTASDCPHSNLCRQCDSGLGPTCASSNCVDGHCVGIAPCSGAACSDSGGCVHSFLCALCVDGRGPACTTAQCVGGFCETIGACSLTE